MNRNLYHDLFGGVMQVADGVVVGGSHGRPLQLRVKGRLFPLPQPKVDTSFVFHSDEKEEPYVLNLNAVGHLTLQSFQGKRGQQGSTAIRNNLKYNC